MHYSAKGIVYRTASQFVMKQRKFKAGMLILTALILIALSGQTALAQTATTQVEPSTSTPTPEPTTIPSPPAPNATATTPLPGATQGNVSSNLTTGVATLPSFYAIRTCLPFNILVQPSAGGNQTGNGTLTIASDPAVISALQVTWTDNVLALSIGGDFETNRTIQATVEVPDPASLQYVQNFGVGDVIVGPGFNATSLSVSSTGLGGVFVRNVSAQQLSVFGSGTSTIAVGGTIGSASIRLDGTAKAFLTCNVAGPVTVALSGISTAFVQGTARTSITGTADGLSKVLFTDGQCTARTSFQSLFGVNIFGDPCNKVGASNIPNFNPVWTCGLLSRGKSDCSSPLTPSEQPVPVGPSPGGGTASTAATSASPPPPPTGSSPGTTTVTGPGGTVTTSTFTSGPGASATAGGLSSTSGFPPLGIFQQATGGAPPFVSLFPGTSGTASSISAPSTASPAPSPTGQTASATSQASSPSGTALVDISIPNLSSGLAAVSLPCLDGNPVPILGGGTA